MTQVMIAGCGDVGQRLAARLAEHHARLWALVQRTASLERLRDLSLLRADDVSGLLQIGRRTLWRWVADGRFPPPMKVNGRTRWLRSRVEAYLAERQQAAEGD